MTTRTQYYVAASLDGRIAEDDDGLDWLTTFGGGDATEDEPEGYAEFIQTVGALVMGARTYDVLVGGLVETWPYEGLPTFVYAHRERPIMDGADVRFVDGAVGERHDEMVAAANGRHLWVVGGGRLASQYVAAGLLDDLLVTVVPVWLGSGIPLFTERVDVPMRLAGTQTFASGMVHLKYDLRV
ncbi:MAG TPA: dihydrofolate reductase family protein [Capillimicrobium sp.]|nr:dihydrofolate reductase family protein [Capillimicrobium sp.]